MSPALPRLAAALPVMLMIALLLGGCAGDEDTAAKTTGTAAGDAATAPAADSAGEAAVATVATTVTAPVADDHPGAIAFAHNCAPCHAAGPGHAGTMRLGLRLGEAQAVLAERENLAPDYVRAIVRNGLGMMPGFRPAEIPDDTLDAIAAWLAE